MQKARGREILGDHVVGYGRPPKSRQWQIGKSGNPQGRPRHPTNLDAAICEVLSEIVLVEIGAQPKRLTVAQALARKIVQKAMTGSTTAVRQVVDAQLRHDEQTKGECETVITAELIFDSEESRLTQLAKENEELRERIEQLQLLTHHGSQSRHRSAGYEDL